MLWCLVGSLGGLLGCCGLSWRRLGGELEAVEREIAVLEERYGVSSRELEAMLRGEEPWRLPEGAEPDVVEWEALLEQRRRLLRRLHWLEEVLCRLRMPSWPGLCTSSLPLLRRG